MPSPSIGLFLKTTIGALTACILGFLVHGAWASWGQVQLANQIVAVAEATSHLFNALQGGRIDRAGTNRILLGDGTSGLDERTSKGRAAMMAGLSGALGALKDIDFAGKESILPKLQAAEPRLVALQQDTLKEIAKPKPERRTSLGQDYTKETSELIDLMVTASDAIGAVVKASNPFIDNLLDMKTVVWDVRSSAGDAATPVSDLLVGLPAKPEVEQKYIASIAKAEFGWATVKKFFPGSTMPPRLREALEKGDRLYIDRVVAEQTRLLKLLLAGGKPEIGASQWRPVVDAGYAAILGVADTALELAREHAQGDRSRAGAALWTQSALLGLAVVVGLGLNLLVSGRVTRPLIIIRDRMAALAGGNLDIDAPYTDRGDEIGGLAKTMATFRDTMAETERLRRDQVEQEKRQAETRRAELQMLADRFNAAVGGIVEKVAATASELQAAALTLTASAEHTSQQSISVAAASTEASSNVASVASATEELSASVVEISRQVGQSAAIASKAVTEAGQTNERVKGLAFAADKIGSIVELINQVAGKTNLLALNATIEAARAGEAGKGFAVVAAEVKLLADQTAKATAEISAQIGAMQDASSNAADAIQGIGATIESMNDIAAQIANSVSMQGEATGEIARSVREASRGTAAVSSNISGVSQAASESNAASARVLASASELSREAELLRAEVAKFLNTVRAA